jgi:hypothetical protein
MNTCMVTIQASQHTLSSALQQMGCCQRVTTALTTVQGHQRTQQATEEYARHNWFGSLHIDAFGNSCASVYTQHGCTGVQTELVWLAAHRCFWQQLRISIHSAGLRRCADRPVRPHAQDSAPARPTLRPPTVLHLPPLDPRLRLPPPLPPPPLPPAAPLPFLLRLFLPLLRRPLLISSCWSNQAADMKPVSPAAAAPRLPFALVCLAAVPAAAWRPLGAAAAPPSLN